MLCRHISFRLSPVPCCPYITQYSSFSATCQYWIWGLGTPSRNCTRDLLVRSQLRYLLRYRGLSATGFLFRSSATAQPIPGLSCHGPIAGSRTRSPAFAGLCDIHFTTTSWLVEKESNLHGTGSEPVALPLCVPTNGTSSGSRTQQYLFIRQVPTTGWPKRLVALYDEKCPTHPIHTVGRYGPMHRHRA